MYNTDKADKLIQTQNQSMDIVKAYYKYGVDLEKITEYSFPSGRLQTAIEVCNNLEGIDRISLRNPEEGLVVSQQEFKVNTVYAFDIDGLSLNETKAFMSQASYQIIFGTDGDPNLTGFFAFKLKGVKTKIPTKLSFDSWKSLITVQLYKESSMANRWIKFNRDDIESIELITLVTLRGLKRALNYKQVAKQNLTENATEFKSDLI